MNFPRRFVEMSGSVLSVVDVGSGPTLLFGHGWLCDANMWAEQIALLAKTHRVIAPDMWGHGLSGALPVGTTSMVDLAHHHLHLLDVLNVEEVAVIGFSLGGLWGAELALAAPERISALVLMASSLAAEPPASRDAYLSVVETIAESGRISQDLANSLVSLFYSDDFRARAPRIVDAHRGRLEAWWTDRLKDSVAPIGHLIFDRRDALDDLRTLGLPVLCISGTEDRALAPASVRSMADTIGSRFAPVPHAGHMLAQEAASEINRQLAEFLAWRFTPAREGALAPL